MHVVVQYVAIPYVSLEHADRNRGAVRRDVDTGYSIPYVTLHGIWYHYCVVDLRIVT